VSIIDRDIESYRAFVCTHNGAYFRCTADDERKHLARLEAARAVVDALIAYKATL
jgi:hypothetical protein